MKVFFVNDSTSNPNWGDRAAATALKHMVAAAGGTIIGSLSEDELRSSTFQNPRTDCDGENRRPNRARDALKLLIPPVILKTRERFIGSWKSSRTEDIVPDNWGECDGRLARLLSNGRRYSDLLDALQDCDVVVIHGDGCMMRNGRIPRAELFLTLLAKRHCGKPVLIVNHTADFAHPDLREMAEHVYPLFDDVVFRDVISPERCRAMCNGRAVPDSAFQFKPIAVQQWLPVAQRPTYFDVWPDIARFDPAQPYVCVGGSSIYGNVASREGPVRGLRHLIDRIGGVYSGQIVLTASDICDQNIMRPIAEATALPLVGLTTPVQQVVDILGNADMYIGGRWHPSIFALRGGTPVIALSSRTFKMEALVEVAGLPGGTFDALSLESESEAIGRQCQRYLERGEELRLILRTWAERECARSWGNVAYLRNHWPGA